MARDSVWSNSDGLAVGFGTRTALTSGSHKHADDGPTEKVVLRFRGEDLADTVSTTGDQIVHAPVIPNGASILSATLTVIEAFTSGGVATLDLGLYDKDGTAVDADGIDEDIALTAIDAIGDSIDCDGADVGTVVATTGGVKVAASYETAAFTAGEAILEVVYATAQ